METAPRSGDVYVATDRGLFTIDQLDRVRQLREFAPGSRSAVEVYPRNDRILYVAWDGGEILRSADRGQTWSEVSRAIPTLGFVTLKVDPNQDTLYAVSPGAGIWKRSFDGER